MDNPSGHQKAMLPPLFGNMVGMFRMQWLVAGAIAAVAGLIAYRTLVPRLNRRRAHDAGSVSADWLANHRNLPGE
jgi:hypothetical protein